MNDPYQTLPPEPIVVDRIAAEQPHHIGRYRVERVLGKGGFGLVYLAHDDQLQRPVAIKVPHRHLISLPEDAGAYLNEARTVAGLDHPNIVPVYDVGSTDEFPCFVVSKFIEGITLAQKIKANRPSVVEATELVATVAETLHYAHRKGLVHRDIKPGNILLDTSGKPFVADFGLALRETDVGKGPRYAGTPAYMSPEQARGEGHRVDGRSDLFSLGVVFYELLTGRRPFKADSVEELLEQIKVGEVRPPRQWDDAIPKELERICLQALSKRASDRYSTGKDMADDLRHFFEQATEEEKRSLRSRVGAAAVPSPAPAPTPVVSPHPTSISDSHPVRIVPKGLRSFDAHDADFFLELLPGPRDRDGLPDSIRFWKTRIEEMDAETTFSVGLICGPSGCGKSSLVKAGLLPRLAKAVTAVYIEATADETESRLLKGLRRQVPDLPGSLGLIEALAEMRRGQFLASGQKVLLVLDQFEQWLHAKRNEENTELVQALRQCNGSRVQCIVMVRDDFWMAVIRFMRDLEIRLLEGQNSAAVDLFPIRHAEKVLTAFGRAFGALPDSSTDASQEHKQFLDQAVSGLAQDGKIICVRLALFAEMMKGKSWTPATLKEVGGTEGIGVTFLEETFSASTASPAHRYHQKAVLSVLKALLPEAWSEIKGHLQSQQELLQASGYVLRHKDFDDFLRILDIELHLITPIDPEGINPELGETAQSSSSEKYYQLTHDYLVPSIREWLIRKQKETRKGRTELRLAVWSSVWNAKPENRNLPSWWEWLGIRLMTKKHDWTEPQRKMMRRATRFHSVRGLTVAVLIAMLGWVGYEVQGTLKAHALLDSLLRAESMQVPNIVADMPPYRRWLNPLLRDAYREAEANSEPRKQLHTSLALLPVDTSQVDYLYGRLLDAAPNEVSVIRDFLERHKDELLDKLWAVAEAPAKDKKSQRLRAASALAVYDPESERWKKVKKAVANDLVSEPAVYLALWMDSLRSVRVTLLAPLSAVYRESSRRDVERSLATDILADYAADQPQVLAELMMVADEKQFAVIYPKFKEQGEQGLPVLIGEINKKPPPDLPSSDEKRENLAKRQANAAVALLRMNQSEKVWPLLKHSPDPRVRSYLIHHLAPLGGDANAIVKRLDKEPDVTIRRALILSLGEFDPDSIAERSALVVKLLQMIYRKDEDPGLHGAAEWVLHHWKQDDKLKEIDKQLQANKDQRLEHIRNYLARRDATAPAANPVNDARWYVNGEGQTMVVIPGPITFQMGSPPTEEGRFGGAEDKKERQVKRSIVRSFAIATKTVTVEHFQRFRKDHKYNKQYFNQLNCPMNSVTWYDATAYCNWLSKREGLEAVYEPIENKEYGPGMKLRPNYLHLSGYRLPTESEWEYACRAETISSRYYGETEELLAKYACYTANSLDYGMSPVGSLKPNDLGLFDMLGNAYQWCGDRADYYINGEDKEDIEDIHQVNDNVRRPLRGRSFLYRASNVRSADRFWDLPTYRYFTVGFRPARTFTP